MMKEIIIYADGACSGNPGPGGWGAVLYYKDQEKTIYGSEQATTNNRMELTAAIKALSILKESCKVTLYTDSNYLKEGITQWIENWKRNNWRTANKKPVKNKELWQELEKEIQRHQITWKWIRGHSGNHGNELADQLAVKGRNEAISKNI